MKKTLIITAICLLIATISHAQNIAADKVPAIVKAKFAALYPNVTDPKWEMEKGDYEAGFKNGTTHTSVVIDAKANLKETEISINVSELPKNASDYLAKTYPGKKIEEAAKITDAKGKVTFEAEVNKKDLLFDDKGTFIK